MPRNDIFPSDEMIRAFFLGILGNREKRSNKHDAKLKSDNKPHEEVYVFSDSDDEVEYIPYEKPPPPVVTLNENGDEELLEITLNEDKDIENEAEIQKSHDKTSEMLDLVTNHITRYNDILLEIGRVQSVLHPGNVADEVEVIPHENPPPQEIITENNGDTEKE